MTTINQTFSPGRFASYMQKSWGENRRRLLLYAAIAIAALVSIDIIAVIFSFFDARNIIENNPDTLGVILSTTPLVIAPQLTTGSFFCRLPL